MLKIITKIANINILKKSNFIGLVILILLADQISKYLVISHLNLYQQVAIFPGLNLFLTYNQGAAFGFLHDAGGWQRWLFAGFALVIAAVILIWQRKLTEDDKLEAYALALILGGALGNLKDRLHYGLVIDFIDFFIKDWHWYTFNLADSAICIGGGLLAIAIFFKKRKK